MLMVRIRINRQARERFILSLGKEKRRNDSRPALLSETDLALRVINRLESIGIYTIEQLALVEKETLMQVEQIGDKTWDKLQELCAPYRKR